MDKKKSKALIVLIIFFLLLLIPTCIYFIISINNHNTNISNTNYSNYESTKQKITSLAQENSLSATPDYGKVMFFFLKLEDKTLTEKDKYNNLVLAQDYLEILYSHTNNHKLYGLNSKLADFSKENFPNYYKKSDFAPIVCLDATCAQNPQPKEILQIIEEINSSNIPQVVKDSFVRSLINPGYMNDNMLDSKVLNYMVASDGLKTSGALTKAGLNEKLSQELNSFLEKKYSGQYKKFTSANPVSLTPVIKKQ